MWGGMGGGREKRERERERERETAVEHISGSIESVQEGTTSLGSSFPSHPMIFQSRDIDS